MIRREGRYFPVEWDRAPVGDPALIPPPPSNLDDLVQNVL